MAYTLADLELADRHLMEGADRIARLRRSIADAERLGQPTHLADQALTTMLTTLDLMTHHQRAIAKSVSMDKRA
jgi:hypothetical protein